jgi:hypothetical protein
MALVDTLMLKANGPVIGKCKVELMGAPLVSWIELIEKTASTVHLCNNNYSYIYSTVHNIVNNDRNNNNKTKTY